ncbi:Ger(x)C family spore germination protein [Halobacillus litoralis]|uniref:Ger(x)C family spore germination protein n=1 Tax=Halobacillus litoralis TaxID=45668 RepID=UPI001CFD1E67|nr:Ger(x)C family spore germination protein [Halobacillus litoralis]
MFLKRSLISLLLLFSLAGCWDIKEIEDIGIVLGIALDTTEDDQLSMIHQFVVPGQIPTQQSGSPEGLPFQNIQIKGHSLFEIIRNNSLESNVPPNFTHLKTILLSKELLEKKRVDQFIDLFIRDHEFRRTVPVFITRDTVEEVFGEQPMKELFPSIQIKELSENHYLNNLTLKSLTIGEMSQYISEEKSFLIPGVGLKEGKVISQGAGIVSSEDFRYQGWLTEEEVEGVRYINNSVEGGYIDLSEDHIEQGPVVLEINGSNTSYHVDHSGETVQLHLKVSIETSLAEDWAIGRDVYTKGWKEDLEEAANKNIKKKIENVIEAAQTEYETDFLNLSQWIHINEPDYFKKHEAEWDELFTDLDVKVSVQTKITEFGTQNFNANEVGDS